MTIEALIFYLLLTDSVIANLIAFFGKRWYMEHFQFAARFFPMGRGWTIYYLILVLWIGSLLYRAGMLGL